LRLSSLKKDSKVAVYCERFVQNETITRLNIYMRRQQQTRVVFMFLQLCRMLLLW